MNTPEQHQQTTLDDPFFFDQEQLQTIAEKSVVSHGLQDHKNNCVLEIDQSGDTLWGQVEDIDSEYPKDVTLRLTDEGLLFSCDCEDITDTSACRHIIAVLCSYADQCSETDKLVSAVDSAIRNRVKRGRSEVEVKHLDDGHWFGTWHAASIGTTSPYPRSYKVTMRSLQQRANFCTCPDYAGNQLGTCKHIEAVLHKISKHSNYQEMRNESAPLPYIYLATDTENGARIMLHRTPDMAPDLAILFNTFFHSNGRFTGRLPEDFFRFIDSVEGRADIHLGEDAVAYTQQLASNASHKERSQEIKNIIRTTNRIDGIRARLYPYQVEGVAFLAGTGRALLADDMGLGKTLQAISAAVWLGEHEGIKKTLIICPASLKHQWAREIAKFTRLESQVIQGTPPQRGVQYRRECSFFILNYELLLRDLSIINETIGPDLVILDEAQRIKNWRTKIATAVKLIPSRFAFVLTGTPLENRLEDLYSLMQVVDPKILGPLWRYMIDFHITDDRDKVLGYRNLSILRQRLTPVMLRRDRRIVSDQLPDRITSRIDVPMTEKQIELHDSAMSAAGQLADIAKKRPLSPSEQNRLMAALQQARMSCNAAGLVDKETKGSPKIDELADILTEVCLESGLKVVVFSQWKTMTTMVESRLRQMNIGYVHLHGGVPTAKRGELMDRFQHDDSIQVFLSTDAGGLGLNLQSGSVLVNLDIPWNPAVLEQRNARIHRLGQTRTVQIITMVAKGFYEEHVLSLVHGKQKLFDNVIAEEASEDVVAVSKKLLEALVEDLADTKKETDDEKSATGTENSGGESDLAVDRPGLQEIDALTREVTEIIEELQETFGRRIERIFGTGGGLLTVLDQVGEDEERLAETLSEKVPVAFIDLRTLTGLERLGAGSPLAESRTLYEANTGDEKGAQSRLVVSALEKVKGAAILIEQNCYEAAMELLVSALLFTAAAKAGRTTPATLQEAGVWIYSEALPKGILSDDEAALIMRTITVSQSPSIPQPLVEDILSDVESFIDTI